MKTKLSTLIILMGTLALSLAACGPDDLASGDPLDGTSWELMAYRKTSPIPGTTLTATFEEGRVHGSAGCNSYSGSYQIEGSAITVSGLAMTEMACMEPEGVMEQEATFAEFLADATTFRLTEEQLQIVISDSHETLTFIPQD